MLTKKHFYELARELAIMRVHERSNWRRVDGYTDGVIRCCRINPRFDEARFRAYIDKEIALIMSDREIETGSVSTGTLRSQDLLPAFDAELRERNPARATELFDFYGDTLNGDFPDGDDPWWVDRVDDIAEWENDLCDALNELAPAGVRFGAHEGDGADFGWWPVEE